MTFAPDTEAALQAAVFLVNTGLRRDGVDAMATVADLDRFFAQYGYAGRRDGDDAEVSAVRAVRDRLRPLFSAGRDEAAEMVNAMLREAHALPYLTRHDHWDWHLHATELDAPFAPAMIYVNNLDKPGFIGRLGSLLAENNINIASFNLGRVEAGEDAIALVGVDQAPSDGVLKAIKGTANVKEARVLSF